VVGGELARGGEQLVAAGARLAGGVGRLAVQAIGDRAG